MATTKNTKEAKKRYFVTIKAICEADKKHSYQIDGVDFDIMTDRSVEVTPLQFRVIQNSGDEFTYTSIDA